MLLAMASASRPNALAELEQLRRELPPVVSSPVWSWQSCATAFAPRWKVTPQSPSPATCVHVHAWKQTSEQVRENTRTYDEAPSGDGNDNDHDRNEYRPDMKKKKGAQRKSRGRSPDPIGSVPLRTHPALGTLRARRLRTLLAARKTPFHLGRREHLLRRQVAKQR